MTKTAPEKVCTECNSPVRENALFCYSCGNKISQDGKPQVSDAWFAAEFSEEDIAKAPVPMPKNSTPIVSNKELAELEEVAELDSDAKIEKEAGESVKVSESADAGVAIDKEKGTDHQTEKKPTGEIKDSERKQKLEELAKANSEDVKKSLKNQRVDKKKIQNRIRKTKLNRDLGRKKPAIKGGIGAKPGIKRKSVGKSRAPSTRSRRVDVVWDEPDAHVDRNFLLISIAIILLTSAIILTALYIR